MSKDAFSGFGVVLKVDEKKLPTITRNSCEHTERIGNKFCPICGTKVKDWIEPDYDTEFDIMADFENRKSEKNYGVTMVSYNVAEYFIGWGLMADYDKNVSFTKDVPPTEEIKKFVEEYLKTIPDQFKVKEFGFYCFMIYS